MTVGGDSPRFLITIDAEGDDLWSRPRIVTTRNAGCLPRFQALCEAHGWRPTYLTSYEMAICPSFQAFGRDLLGRGVGEIGMHLHAWSSPPGFALTEDDDHHQPYLVEYPEPVMAEKVSRITNLLEETFGVVMVSHRAGRWSFDEAYARILVQHGYRVDCSVTPHVSWQTSPGDPCGSGGTDFSDFPEEAYFLDLDDIRRPGASPLLEVPVTIRAEPGMTAVWMRPDGRNRGPMLELVERVVAQGGDYLELMLHSSELMPGGSPTFARPTDVERLYDDLEEVFEAIAGRFRGATLAEYHRWKTTASEDRAETLGLNRGPRDGHGSGRAPARG